jgi:hypothetical protein
VEEVFAAISPTDIREIKKKNPNNLATLLNKAVGQLNGWIQRVNNAVDAKAAPDSQAALNCMRLITRIMPFLVEDQADNFVECVFWLNLVPVDSQDGSAEKRSFRKSVNEEVTASGEPVAPLAIRLLDALLTLLFMPNFTIPARSPAQSSYAPNGQHVWAAGIGIDGVVSAASKGMWQNRLETLKCLLACLSETLYIPPDRVRFVCNKWLEYIVTTEGQYTQVLFLSLVNVACSYDPVGWGIPYNHVMFGDDQEAVATVALQIINILLSYSTYKYSNTLQEAPTNQQQEVSIQAQNHFVKYLQQLKRAHDFGFLLGAFERLVGNPMRASNTRLPYSMKVVACYQDMLMLLWRGFEENKKLLTYVIKSASSPQLFNHVLYFMYSGRKDLTQLGIVQLSTFILLLLSGERDYCVSLNKGLTTTQPRVGILAEIPQLISTASHADVLVLTIIRLLTDSHPSLGPIHECLLTILANISPFVKSLSMPTCQNLMRLFEYFSRPKILFASEHSRRFVHLLLEMFNNLVQYQYEGNARLVYSILRAQNEFSKLAHIRIVTPPELTDKGDMQGVGSSDSAPNPPAQPEGITESAIRTEANTTEGSTYPEGSSEGPTPLEQASNHTTGDFRERSVDTPEFSEKANVDATSTAQEVNQGAIDSQQQVVLGAQVNDPNKLQIASFVPTNEWLDSWKRFLPIDNILRIITTLSPQIQSLCTGSTADEVHILEFLQRSTLVGLLPVPHPILIRRYQPNEAVQTWLLSYLWGNVYLQHTNPPIFLGTNVKLFVINSTS